MTAVLYGSQSRSPPIQLEVLMRYELLIAARHVTSRKGRSLSLVTSLAIAGVALGVAALVGGLSITKGFEDAFRDKLLEVTAHIFARPYTNARYEVEELEGHIKSAVPEVVGVAPTTYHKTILSGPGGTIGGFIKGVDPERAGQVLKLPEYMIEGELGALSLGAEPTPMIIGAQLAERMRVEVGGFLTALSSSNTGKGSDELWSTQRDAPTSLTFKVVGVFRAGYDEYDTRFAYVNIKDAERIFGTNDNVRGFEIKVRDPSRAAEVAPRSRARSSGAMVGLLIGPRRSPRTLSTPVSSLVAQRSCSMFRTGMLKTPRSTSACSINASRSWSCCR